MGPIILAAVAVLAVFLVLAFFARGGPTETPGVGERHASDTAPLFQEMTHDDFGVFVTKLVNELGFRVASAEVREGRVDVIAEDPTPLTGQRIYFRGVLPPTEGMVQSAEVLAAIDNARGHGFGKAIVVTPSVFSDEAVLAARGAAADLIDGPELEKLVRKHLPEYASRLVRR